MGGNRILHDMQYQSQSVSSSLVNVLYICRGNGFSSAYVGIDGAIKRGHCQVSHHPAADSFSLVSADDWLAFPAVGPMWATRVRHLCENQTVSVNWIIIDRVALTVIELQ